MSMMDNPLLSRSNITNDTPTVALLLLSKSEASFRGIL
jgi:hypothetical protein